MRVHSIAIADPPLRSSYGLRAPYALRTVFELTSEHGVTGTSETHGSDAITHGFQFLRSRAWESSLIPTNRRAAVSVMPNAVLVSATMKPR